MRNSNSRMKEKVESIIGKTIKSVVVQDDKLRVSFKDGTLLTVTDEGQICCEHRYMHTDDELGYYDGSTFTGVDVRGGSEEESEYGEYKELEFLIVSTNKGDFTIVNYNEHNGYYGGFDVTARIKEGGLDDV